jgi:hypothetical protein
MGLKAHAPSAKTGRNNGDTCFIEQMAEISDAFALGRYGSPRLSEGSASACEETGNALKLKHG